MPAARPSIPIATGAIGPFAFDCCAAPFLLGYHIAPDNAFLPPGVAAMSPSGGVVSAAT